MTTRKATIVTSEPGLVIAIDDRGEGHLLLFTVNALQDAPEPECAEGDRGTLTLTEGGWVFTKDDV